MTDFHNDRDEAALPPKAQERLLRQDSSTALAGLSAGELLALRQTGAQPLGLAMGVSVFSLGGISLSSAVSGELKFLTGALRTEQRLVLDRLRAEAALLGADGVLGVRLTRRRVGGDAPLLEMQAIGTAIRGSGMQTGSPWISGLSGTEYAALQAAGYRPVGLTLGNCAYFRVPDTQRYPTMAGATVQRSYERADYTQATYGARHLALERMRAEGKALHGDGIVGVQTDIQRHVSEMGLFVHFFASGTAITRISGGNPSIDITIPL